MKSTNIFRTLAALACLCGVSAALLAGCGRQAGDGGMAINKNYPQSGFIAPSGSTMVQTPEGFYAFRGNYLYYITPDLQKSTVVCGKPQCTHNANPVTDPYKAAECDAYFSGLNPIVAYCDSHLYVAAENLEKEGEPAVGIYQISMDGSEKKLFFDTQQARVSGMCIYKGDMYLAEVVYEESGKTDRIRKVSMKDPKDAQTLFETDAYPEATLNWFNIYGDFCYFAFHGAHEGSGFRHCRVNLKTGESEVLLDSNSDLATLYMNKNGGIAEEQYVGEKNASGDYLWESVYSRIDPGSLKATALTQQEFPLLAQTPWLCGADEEYVYFHSMLHPSWSEASWPDDAAIYACTEDGSIAATIPLTDEFKKKIFYVLPGTDNYLFVRIDDPMENRYFYAPKSEFDGGTVELKEILLK